MTFGGINGVRYTASNCTVLRSEGKGNEAMHCSIPAGVGQDHPIRVSYGAWSFLSSAVVGIVGGSAEEFQYARVSFAPPTLERAELEVTSGLDTAGGDYFILHGSNFGPAGEPASTANITVSYRLVGQTPTYVSPGCTVR